MKTVIGLFDAASDAYSAQNELLAAGIARDRVSVVTSEANRTTANATGASEATEDATIGAATGALAGGAAGLLASLSLLTIPGFGALMAMGPILSILTGAGLGAAAGGLIGGLVGMGIPENEAEVYNEGVSRGGTLLSVEAADGDADRIAMILSQHSAVDIDKRASEWVTAGWQRRYPAAAVSTTTTSSSIPAAAIDPRTRGIERGTDAAEAADSAEQRTTDIGTTRRMSSARIYNPK